MESNILTTKQFDDFIKATKTVDDFFISRFGKAQRSGFHLCIGVTKLFVTLPNFLGAF